MSSVSRSQRLSSKLAGFVRGRGANISTIFAILAIPMTLVAGGAIDVAMQEHDRIRLQNALDTGLIAAASISQTMTAEETVRSYLNAAQISGYTLSVNETKSVSARTVTASATIVNTTNFLRLISIPTLDVVASGTAEEAYQNIELSLVLDLSGSMRGSRINAMRPAAKNFVSQLLTEKTKAFTTISLIPYAGQVSVGTAAFNAFGGTRTHDKSSCFGNKDKKYVAGMGSLTTAEHVPQFSTWTTNTYKDGFDPWNCPTEETSVTFYSNDAAKMHTAIDGYHMFDGTATHIAAKWGLFLLDPAVKTTLATAKKNGLDLMPAAFADRPAAFGDKKTLKIMVIMTDGEVVAQQRPKSKAPVNEQPKSKDENETVVGQTDAIAAMNAACDDAKGKGVTIYAIGYDVVSGGFRDKLKACASGDGRYYDATSTNINKIFQDVALSIYPLRLTH